MRPFLPLQGAICELPAGQKFRSQPSDVVPFSATYAGIGSELQAGLQPSSALCSSLFSLPPFQGSQALGLNAYKRQGCWMPMAQPSRLRDTQWTCHPVELPGGQQGSGFTALTYCPWTVAREASPSVP